MGWLQEALDALKAGDTGTSMRLGLRELFPGINGCKGFLVELDAALETVDGSRLTRAYDGAIPHLLNVNMALYICGRTLEIIGRGPLDVGEASDEQVMTLVAINRRCRGKDGAMLFHVRAAQADVLQARKLFRHIEQSYEGLGGPSGEAEFDRALLFAAAEFDSVMFTLRVLNQFLPR